VRQLPSSLGAAAAVVRGHTYTTEHQSGCNSAGTICSPVSLDPVCASGAEQCTEEECSHRGKALDVRFNSRSYLLADFEEKGCARRSFGDSYKCVDYAAGAYQLAGRTLSFSLDLSAATCGCNAAIYLVAMPQNDDATSCGDYYCDANAVCGTACAEIDLIEANRNAFVTTVHVADDSEGSSFGIGHYVRAEERRLYSPNGHSCAYGPDKQCAINSARAFTVRFSFSAAGALFGFEMELEQEERVARLRQPVRYIDKPTKGSVASAAKANKLLGSALDNGLTLVVSYWAGETVEEMAWLDTPCSEDEVAEWSCSDEWTEHPKWPWTCPFIMRCTRPEAVLRGGSDAKPH